MADPSRPSETSRPSVAATPARQGRYGKHVFWVLLISTLLAAIGLFAAWSWKAPDLSQPGAQERNTSRTAASAFHAPEPAAVVPPPGADHTAPSGPATPR